MRDRLPILSWLFYVGLTAVTLAFSPAIPNAFTGPKVVAALLGAALVAPAVAHHYKRVSPIFLLQFLALVISTVFSLNPAVSLWGGDWRRMGLITWMAILIVGAAVPLVIDCSKVRWTHFLRFVVVTGSIAAAYGILQWLNLDPFLPASLRAQLVQEFGGVYRSIGTIGQPTYFANYLLYPFFCALALLRFDAALRWRRFAGIAAGVVFAALLTTMSRGAILGACVGLVILGSAAVNRRRVAAGFALAVVLALAGGTALLYTQAYGPQLQSRLDYIAKDATGGGRLQLWGDVAQRILPDFWLHGTGSGMFRPAFALKRSDRYTAFGPDVHWETAHNIFLDRWTEQGIAGLAMLAVFIAAVVSNMRKALRQSSDPRERWALTAVLCAFVSACIGNLFNGEVIVTAHYLCLWAGLSFATVECFGSGRSAFGPQTASKATALRFAAAATVSCLLIWHAGNNWRAEKNLALAIQASERGNEAQLLDAGRASAEVFPERGAYALEFSNAVLRFVAKKSLSAERRREIAEIGIDHGMRATSGDRSMLAFYYISELGTIAGDPRTETWLRRLIAVDPNWYRPHKLLASWLLIRQRIPEARAEIQLAQHFSPYDAESAALGTQIDTILQKAPAASPSDSEQKRLVQALNRVPLTFESNQGQADSQFEFLTRTRNYTAYLNRAEAIFVGNANGKTSDVLKMRFLGANAILAGTGVDQQSGRANYYMGSDPSKWRVNVPMFGKVAYQSVYPGIDLIYYGNESQLEYDMVVAPGADPKKIALEFEGDIESFSSDRDGSLSVRTRSGIVQLRPPHTYQQSSSGAHVVGSRFVVEGHIVHFAVDHYDETKTLTIDPVLIYSTYLGGSGEDASDGRHSIALDASGNTYIVGRTTSTDFPLGVAGSSTPTSAFVVKLTSSGSAIEYKTYLGTFARAAGVAVDASGNAYVTGQTGVGFPTTNSAPQGSIAGQLDAFIAKVSASGSLNYSTYWGGSGYEDGAAIAIDASGEAVVMGTTESTNFPTVNAYQSSFAGSRDAFVTKINPDGSVLYSTYLGGSFEEAGLGAAMDMSGSAYVTGFTTSSNFPIQNPLQSTPSENAEAFVTKINANGSALIYSTYLGGAGIDQGNGIAIDASGSAFVVGITSSPDFPGAVPLHEPHGNYDGFLVNLSPSGGTLIYSRYIGGTGVESACDVALDSSGNAYISGYTDSDVSLFSSDQVQPARGGLNDAFLLKLNPEGFGLRLWTYLGGSESDYGTGVAVDASGNAYTVVSTYSANFPTVSALKSTYGGNGDVAVVKIGTASDLSVTIDSTASGAGPGATLTYFITVSNGGPASATGVVMHGFVPSGTALTSLTTTQGSCDPESSGHSLTCPLGTINAGNSVQIVLRVSVTGQNASSISALAWLTADSDDLFAANNVAQNAITLLTRRPGQITSQ